MTLPVLQFRNSIEYPNFAWKLLLYSYNVTTQTFLSPTSITNEVKEMKKVLVLLVVAAVLMAGTVFVAAEQPQDDFQSLSFAYGEVLGNDDLLPCGGHGGGSGGSPG
jgi:hypothetical protein